MSKITLITKKTEVITLKTGSRGPQGIKGDKGDQGDVTLAQLNTKVDKFMATNLVTNGDFINGTTGWSSFNGVQTVSNGIYTNTGNGTSHFVFTEQNLPILNARYYVKIRFRVTNSSASSIFVHMLGNTSGGNFNVINVPTPVGNQWYDMSVITNISNAVGTNIIFRFAVDYVTPANANGMVIECDNALVINLTQLFGAGNEPTRDQMDYLLSNFPNSWFNGTVELMNYKQLLDYVIDLDNAKANRTQEAWITPTLVNGATGTIQYRRNQFGRLEFIGTLSNAFGTISLTLLPGYRPTSTRRVIVPRADSTGHRVVLINSAGQVVPDLPSGTFSIDLTSCSIPLD